MSFFDKTFHLTEQNTSLRQELLGALTSFFAIAYIIFLTPGYLSQTGMDYSAVLVATCVASALGCFLSAAFGMPFMMTPGVGLNAFFTYTLCFAMGYTWQQGLAVVFLSGLCYLIITVTPLREKMITCIPASMKNAISAGLGLFIALLGLLNAGLITAQNGTLALGELGLSTTVLALLGLLITGVLMAWKLRGALLIGIIATTLLGFPLGVTQLPTSVALSSISLSPLFLQADFGGLLSLGLLPLVTAVITFTICLCFDTLGSLICIAGAGKLLERDGGLGKYSRSMTVAALSSCLSCFVGGMAIIPPVEGSTGIADGARTPLHAIGTGLCFLLAIFVAPIAGMIPPSATTPSLILIGMLMIGNATNIYWHNIEIALPCFLTMVMIPFTYSVADGIGIGLIAYVVINMVSGKGKTIPPITYGLAAMFIIMYILSAL